MAKNTVKLNESQLNKIIAESVKKVLKEGTTLTIRDAVKTLQTFLQDEENGLGGPGDYVYDSIVLLINFVKWNISGLNV